MGNTFSKVFLPVFSGVILIPIMILCLFPHLLSRRHRRDRYRSNFEAEEDTNGTELSEIATNSANIDRLSAAIPYPPHPSVRPLNSGAPLSAATARHRDRMARELANPFTRQVYLPSNSAAHLIPIRSLATINTRSAASLATNASADTTIYHQSPVVPAYSPLNDNNHLPPLPFLSSPASYADTSTVIPSSSPNVAVLPLPGHLAAPERAYLRNTRPAGRAPALGPALPPAAAATATATAASSPVSSLRSSEVGVETPVVAPAAGGGRVSAMKAVFEPPVAVKSRNYRASSLYSVNTLGERVE